jgi:putative DNA primase/helicase
MTGKNDNDQQQEACEAQPEDHGGDPTYHHYEIWPEPVTADEVMMEIIGILSRHLVMTPEEQLTVALWILHSHCVELARHSPFLSFESPTKRCAKSTAQSTVAVLVPRAMPMTHVTGASLFRLIHKDCPTVIVDELDLVIHRNRDLRVVLNASHCRTTAYIPRVVDGSVVRFRVYGPKVLACIGRLPDTLQDRSIVINLRRKTPEEHVEPLPLHPESFYGSTHSKILRLMQDLKPLIAASNPTLPAGLNDRAADNWRPLLQIAEALGPEWLSIAMQTAVKISRMADIDSVDPAEQLIRDIKGIFDQVHGATFLTADELHTRLLDIDAGLWAEFERGQPLTRARLGRMLTPFGIHSRVQRIGPRVVRAYHREDFADAFRRYCPADPARNVTEHGLQEGVA